MIVTGALLAEFAAVVHNKLDVKGGVVDSFRAGPDRLARVTLVVLIQPEPFDQAATIDLKISDPAGKSSVTTLDVPQSSLGGEVGFVLVPLQVPVPVDGRYLLSITSHSGSVSLPLKVSS
ncbi:hypothetical protein BH11ACT7_BH11ACT7_34040 [soil metagenome]